MDEFNEILSPHEISEIESFIDRPVMVEAVKKVLMKSVEAGTMKPGKKYNPISNYIWGVVGSQYSNQGMINNEALGADLRAKWEGVRMVVNGFNDLEKFKKVAEPIKAKENKAR